MKFYVGGADSAKNLPDRGEVKVVSLPERTVASIGIKGRVYTRQIREEQGKACSLAAGEPALPSAGAAYAVYWDAPFVPWFLKHSEVHIPVTEKKQ